MEIEKAYFTLGEVLDRWSLPEADVAYLAENDQLRLSIRILNLPIEFGDCEETDDGRCYSIPCERSSFNGLLDLHVQDVFQLFRIGEVSVTRFGTTSSREPRHSLSRSNGRPSCRLAPMPNPSLHTGAKYGGVRSAMAGGDRRRA